MLVTDHAPLKWMASTKDNFRVTRWFLALQDFRFQVDHRPGREYANADALSCRDACLGWIKDNHRLRPVVKESGNPFPTPLVRGVVVEGVYRRYPVSKMGDTCAGSGGSRGAILRGRGMIGEQAGARYQERDRPDPVQEEPAGEIPDSLPAQDVDQPIRSD